jgi:catechol 2,3-dioxygenase-like lactoylglutathione lyase family enzyme
VKDEAMSTRVHHTAICVRDLDASLRFWRDGMGMTVMMNMGFDGRWTELFAARSDHLHSVFLGDPARADAGVVELVVFDGGMEPAAAPGPPAEGFFLVSCYVDVDVVLARLASLGLGGEPRRITVPGPGAEVPMATVRDPDGVLVELIGVPAP